MKKQTEIAAKKCEFNVVYYITGIWHGYYNTPVKLYNRVKTNKKNKTYQEYIFKSVNDKNLLFSALPNEVLFINKQD